MGRLSNKSWLLAAALLVAANCGTISTDTGSGDTGGRDYPMAIPPGDVQYVRANYYEDYSYDRTPAITVFSSRSELDSFIQAREIRVYLTDGTHIHYPFDKFSKAVEKYGDGFFADRYLVAVSLVEGSGGIRHSARSIGKNGDITIDRLLCWICTDDMAQWYVIIELDNSFKPKEFSITLVDNKPADWGEWDTYSAAQ